MWLFFNDAFLSIVECRDGFPAGDRRNRMLVRARAAADIPTVFPDAVVEHTPTHDYAYRTVLRRAEVAKVLYQRVFKVDYGNFKNSVTDHSRHSMLLNIWTTAVHFFRTGSYSRDLTPTITGRVRNADRELQRIRDLDDGFSSEDFWWEKAKTSQ